MDTNLLPTHISKVIGRLHAAGSDASGDTFLLASYVHEVLLKTIALTLCAGLKRSSPEVAYKFDYQLIRGDGLGTWEEVIYSIVSQPYLAYLPHDYQPLTNWLTRKRTKDEDKWVRDCVSLCQETLSNLGLGEQANPKSYSIRYLFTLLVRIRNKTKAHGAVGPDFFAANNSNYVNVTDQLIMDCPLMQWDWLYLAKRKEKGNVKAVSLQGHTPRHLLAKDADLLQPQQTGIYFRSSGSGVLYYCGDLLLVNTELSSFKLPNGNYADDGSAEFIDYATGSLETISASHYRLPPAPLPASATEGLGELDIFSNVFGNLPSLSTEYVERKKLQGELEQRVTDKNHPIVTLHGQGGAGKTTLALFIAHKLSKQEDIQFEHILWFSSRDLELKPSGASNVRRKTTDLDSIWRQLNGYFKEVSNIDTFSKLLQDPGLVKSKGILFIFDNFETIDDPSGLHQFLDTHTHIPNKILITSRERAFKGDYPIEVAGMDPDEARQLIANVSRSLGIEAMLTLERREEIISYTNRHAYVMRVLLGEIAKERAWMSLSTVVPRRSDLLGALFERSFNKLSDSGRWVFLTVGNWRSPISELALLATLGLRETIDVENGLDECLRLSLISRHEYSDGSYYFSTPELAHLFAKKKLDGDPDKLLILEDRNMLLQFGATNDKSGTNVVDAMTTKFFNWAVTNFKGMGEDKRKLVDATIQRIAELRPQAWIRVADYKKKVNANSGEIAYALRRAVEECPYDKDAWLARAEYAEQMGDESTRIMSLVSAVDAAPDNMELVREVSYLLANYIDAHKADIPRARRGVYLASVRSHMVRLVKYLDATGLSRLAWLYLLEGNTDEGRRYAMMGLNKEPRNPYCKKIIDKVG